MPKANKKLQSALRNVSTLQTLNRECLSGERHHLVSRFSQLENERARLERECEMWTMRVKATEEKLTKVRTQIDDLQQLIMEQPVKVPAARKAKAQHRPQASTEAAGKARPPSHSFHLDY
ncbi:hypothetical protein [Flexibacterium corallicola]|uniref:hypothetical protein n=1 Tax=Flexibacterium corallicola TaxID=3037259 RepID=UPI00286ECAE4|nr:hypothetical protein [Pseudovibrio sp. M1P-2-3]